MYEGEVVNEDGEWRPWRHTTMTRIAETDSGQSEHAR
jgi:hypothetical protein